MTFDGLHTQLPDVDPDETREWLNSFESVVAMGGRTRARFLVTKLLERARAQQVGLPSLVSTDYINTVPPDREPWFPGDEEMELRIRRINRWNAAVMVTRANKRSDGIGGHISTYASSASLYEVGFNHFFHGKDDGRAGDQVYYQGHAAPGVYARAFLEGRLSEARLDEFPPGVRRPRAELLSPSPADARLLGVPHRLDGAGAAQRHLPGALHPLLPQPADRRHLGVAGVLSLGDGECDEPESLRDAHSRL